MCVRASTERKRQTIIKVEGAGDERGGGRGGGRQIQGRQVTGGRELDNTERREGETQTDRQTDIDRQQHE